MRFTSSNVDLVDDGQGGRFLEGTFELTIVDGTGIYKPFAGGNEQHLARLNRASGLKIQGGPSGGSPLAAAAISSERC
jgi:hypothetical protein